MSQDAGALRYNLLRNYQVPRATSSAGYGRSFGASPCALKSWGRTIAKHKLVP